MFAGALSRLKLIGAMLGVVLAGYVVGALLERVRLPGVELDASPSLEALVQDRASPSIGPASARVTVIIVTDYQCAVCKIDHRDLGAAIEAHPEIRFVFKEWAILGPASRSAARMALAANYQGKYLAARHALMTSPAPLTQAVIRVAMARSGADMPRLDRDLARHGREIDGELARASRQAFGLGLPGTPGYLVGHRLVIGRLDGSKLERLIDHADGRR